MKKTREQLEKDVHTACLPDPEIPFFESRYSESLGLMEFIPPDENNPTPCRNERKNVNWDDKINPHHYQKTCGTSLEVIDFIKSILTASEFIGYCAGNAMKYRLRAGKKSKSIETDIKKAMWYEEKIKNVE